MPNPKIHRIANALMNQGYPSNSAYAKCGSYLSITSTEWGERIAWQVGIFPGLLY